ncbi:L-type lectin-domain containing receptor kinase IX.1-like [Prunus yedoensis var. nudiflora]|uniref:L-type lectin-domain containing receptor kinase IX.1-like n=1 Tax=Prunus yedoensis var. nudiflora TaxID=2094558 RepID=A0A314YCV8_PRUYE|nr:L-type lectin-domain containing receptor kinase IX.1-like [Prunus yedoensis var. nudiflora]
MVVLLLLLLFHLAPCATSLNFSFPTFPNGINTLSLEGDAFVYGDFLQLTKSAVRAEKDYSVGRATYSQPFLLRDNATGKLADFTTTFTFTIDSQNKLDYSDGFAFFLAPNGSALNTTQGRGPSLGLPTINPEKNESTNLYPFVAVEFDIFHNDVTSVEDPAGDHVGIDVNSVKSKVTKAWNGSITDGRVNSASIRYDSGSKHLSVTFTTYENGVWVGRYLDYMVDVNEILQGWVIVGFSAATGSWTALHRINSWSFFFY